MNVSRCLIAVQFKPPVQIILFERPLSIEFDNVPYLITRPNAVRFIKGHLYPHHPWRP